MSYLIKLVRDRIGEVRAAGDVVSFGPIEDTETYLKLLRQKLVEEVAEYIVDPSVAELGDVYDVLAALCWRGHGITVKELREQTAEKFEQRGGFDLGTAMYASREDR